MGLDFCKRTQVKLENSPHWSYGGFHRFRKRVAKSIGIDLEKMKGFESIDCNLFKGPFLEWPEKNPVEILLSHSDCDGVLSSEDCETIAPILEGIVGAWGEDKNNPSSYDTIAGNMLVLAMRECAEEGADLVFC